MKKTVAGPGGAGSGSRPQKSVCNDPAPHMYSDPSALYKRGRGLQKGRSIDHLVQEETLVVLTRLKEPL